jgi:hypothetical protein
MQEYYYIYGIVNCTDKGALALKGIEGREVLLYKYEGYSLVYSPIDSRKIEINYQNLQCHESVLDMLMIDYDVLPFAFSTILLSEASLGKLCNKYNKKFTENFAKIGGMAEMGLKVLSDEKLASEEIAEDQAETNSGYKYMLNIFKTHKGRKQKEQEVKEKTGFIQERLAALIKDEKPRVLPGEGILFKSAYLIEKNDVRKFVEVVEELQEDCEYTLIASGPWPPYSFVSLDNGGDE